VLDDLDQQFPGLKQEVMNDEGQVRQFVNIYVNDEDIRYLQSLKTRVEEGDSLAILPAVAGGSPAALSFPSRGEGEGGGVCSPTEVLQ
jgi:molybdopterin converting factor small subunit